MTQTLWSVLLWSINNLATADATSCLSDSLLVLASLGWALDQRSVADPASVEQLHSMLLGGCLMCWMRRT